MKLKVLLLITPLLTLSISLFARPLTDSIGIENLDGKKVILHKLDPKDNYYSIGRRYNVKPNVIIQFNNNAPLKIGNVIKVPTERSFLETTKPAPAQQPQYKVTTQSQPPAAQQQQVQQPTQVTQAPANNDNNTGSPTQQYKVSPGETLYSIARRFNSTVEDITKINGLTSTTVTPGQIIKVRADAANVPVAAPVVAKRDSTSPYATSQDSSNASHFNANRFGLFEKNEKGVATWIDDTSLDPNKKLVLHRTAPIGTVIKITNPMTNRTTFAKVVGRFNDSESTKDVILVMTKNVAESIGALDKRIHVDISYGSPNE
jgi:LysM repeat protein